MADNPAVTTIACTPENDEACRLVGRFLQSFATMEQAIDAVVGAVLDLKGGTVYVLAANIPFQKKVEILFAGERTVGAKPDKGRQLLLDRTRKAILALNDKRVIFAHCQFGPAQGSGVIFQRVVPKQILKVDPVAFTPDEVHQLCQKALATAADIKRIADEMKKYMPSLDFSDPRNSGLFVLM